MTTIDAENDERIINVGFQFQIGDHDINYNWSWTPNRICGKKCTRYILWLFNILDLF